MDDATYLEQVKAALQREQGQRTQAQKDGADMAIRAFPEIVWWELDPVRGSLEQIDPPGAKTLLRGAADIQHFKFRFRAAGVWPVRIGTEGVVSWLRRLLGGHRRLGAIAPRRSTDNRNDRGCVIELSLAWR